MELGPHVLTTSRNREYSEFDSKVELSPYTPEPVALPLTTFYEALVLKLFRREPAITKLD